MSLLTIDNPPPLPPHAVTLLLSYFASLDQGLPPHLISAPLRQRHTFLGLGSEIDTPQDAATYLCWPSQSEGDEGRVTELLATLPSADEFDPLVAYDTKYSFDGEAVYAHAYVPARGAKTPDASGLRVVFRWEAGTGDGVVQGHSGSATNVDNWKYHDAKPMPFPPHIFASPSEACNPPSMSESHAQSSTSLAQSDLAPASINGNTHHNPEHEEDDGDDDYWNAYGHSNHDSGDEGPGRSVVVPRSMSKESINQKAEDAYWAQYASVHGSADSTRPSPLPQKRKLHDPSQPLPGFFEPSYFDQFEPVLHPKDPSEAKTDGLESHDEPRISLSGQDISPTEGPNPEVLARRLYAASPRPTRSPSPAFYSADSNPSSILLQNENMDALEVTIGSPDNSDGRTLTPPDGSGLLTAIEEKGSGLPDVKAALNQCEEVEQPMKLDGIIRGLDNAEVDCALRDAIKGVYSLWRAKHGSEVMEQVAKERFVGIVRDVLESDP